MSAAALVDACVTTDGVTRLRPTNLTIRAGTVTAIVGPNGSGKSTMLALVAGELSPTEGRVEVDGVDLAGLRPRQCARLRALLSADRHVEFGFSVREVVSWGRTAWRGTSEAQDDEQVIDRVIHDLDLGPLADRTVLSLSSGERTRVHLARVLAQRAPLLLLDEADADLDLIGRHQLDSAMRSHTQQGGTVIVVSHDVARIRRVSDDAILLADGSVIASGPSAEVLSGERLRSVFGIPLELD